MAIAITRGAFSSTSRSVAGTDASLTHTVAASDTLLIFSVFTEAQETIQATPTWSAGGTFVLVDTVGGTSNGDAKTYTYAMVDPPAAVGGTITATMSSNDNSISTAMCYAGTEITAVADAFQLLEQSLDDAGSTTNVYASGGTAGNAVYQAATFRGGDGFTSTNNAGFNELYDSGSGTNTNSDISAYVTDFLGTLPVAVTNTWSASDENAGHYFEILVPNTFRTSSGSPSITPITASGTGIHTHGSDGSPSITPVESAGAGIHTHGSDGSPSITPITADGTASIVEDVTTADGSPSITPITAAGVAEIIREAVGSASISPITASGNSFIWPKVYLNTSESLIGATEMTVASANAAGTSITFDDSVGAPVGALFLGVENRINGDVGWIAVTVTEPTGPTVVFGGLGA